ncbi:MAG TPA: glycosyltransferase [Myxococcota bacterium]|nr:glycosyltransferase [Myxococcota bacterium]
MSTDASAPGAPLLSVVMPMRDSSRYVAEAVESILAQSFGDFEFLIFDDGSSDDSCEIVRRHATHDRRITLFQGSAVGYAVWLREGMRRARGELVARMDADDVSHPERFARQVQYMQEHPECVALGADVMLVDPERRPIRLHRVPREHAEIERALWLASGPMPHPVVVLRRNAVLAAGNYRTDQLWAEDLDLFLRLSEVGRLANLPEVLLEWRRHPKAVGSAQRREQRYTQNRILADARKRRGLAGADVPLLPDLSIARVEDLWHDWARAALGGGHRATARHYARLLLRAEPFAPRSWRMLVRAALGVRFTRPSWRDRQDLG